MQYRVYDPERDKDAVHRIWREIGWADSDESERAKDYLLKDARALVTDIDGEPECLACSLPADLCYLEETLSLSVVAVVTTSRVARKMGFAGRLTAQLIAQDVAAGASASALGMFDQGFYNRLGFGTGVYEHIVRFDPATLRVPGPTRPPKRLASDHVDAMMHAIHNRRRVHGSVNIYGRNSWMAELSWSKDLFGLGYYDDDGETLTHFLWASGTGKHGPYRILFLIYNTRQQFLELMGVVKGLGDQVHSVEMLEPAHIQMQDLIETPFRQYAVTEKSEHPADNNAYAYWQLRICDLDACLAATHLCGEPVRFNLSLHDPIEKFLDEDEPWRGVGGDYIVTLGAHSGAEPGKDGSLPTLRAGVGAFSRLWLGVRPARSLAITDDLVGPNGLLDALDKVLVLPTPQPDMDL